MVLSQFWQVLNFCWLITNFWTFVSSCLCQAKICRYSFIETQLDIFHHIGVSFKVRFLEPQIIFFFFFSEIPFVFPNILFGQKYFSKLSGFIGRGLKHASELICLNKQLCVSWTTVTEVVCVFNLWQIQDRMY